MKNKINWNLIFYTLIYVYLSLPVMIFMAGWCKWYIGIPVTVIIAAAVVLCVREHREKAGDFQDLIANLTRQDMIKILVIFAILAIWVVFSGIGGYAWQNEDHLTRNALFGSLVYDKWPVIREVEIDGTLTSRGLVYYIGFWLPAALVGKLFGMYVGFAAQYVWALLGLVLLYALICVWQKKIAIWPLVVLIMFSGLDAVGNILVSFDELKIFGYEHLEAWSGDFQFSSMTTQLFWVFNQSIAAWLCSCLIFTKERVRNIIFVWSTLLLTSTFSFAGLIPFVAYYLIVRTDWNAGSVKFKSVFMTGLRNWGSLQNILAGGLVGIISVFYLMSNVYVGKGLIGSLGLVEMVLVILVAVILACVIAAFAGVLYLKGRGKYINWILPVLLIAFTCYAVSHNIRQEWLSPVFYWVNMMLFLFLEAGVFLACVYPFQKKKGQFWLNAVWLYLIPLIVVGGSCDFCMRASIPGLFLLALWCIDVLAQKQRNVATYALIVLLIIGSVTPIHEIKRTYANSRNYHVTTFIDPEDLFRSANFGSEPGGLFWEYIAK